MAYDNTQDSLNQSSDLVKQRDRLGNSQLPSVTALVQPTSSTRLITPKEFSPNSMMVSHLRSKRPTPSEQNSQQISQVNKDDGLQQKHGTVVGDKNTELRFYDRNENSQNNMLIASNRDIEPAYAPPETQQQPKITGNHQQSHNKMVNAAMLPIYVGDSTCSSNSFNPASVQDGKQMTTQQNQGEHVLNASTGKTSNASSKLSQMMILPTGSRTSQSQARHLSRLKNRPQALAVSGPLQIVPQANQHGSSALAGSATVMHHQLSTGPSAGGNKPLERPLKNKFIHRAAPNAGGGALVPQKIPLVEKPRSYLANHAVTTTGDEAIDAAIFDTEIQATEQAVSSQPSMMMLNSSKLVANLNPVLQSTAAGSHHMATQQRKVRSVLRPKQKNQHQLVHNHPQQLPHDHHHQGNLSQQVLSQRPPMKPSKMKKADLTPYMAATDHHNHQNNFMETQMRMNSQGFFTANPKQLFSQRTENALPRNSSTNSGYFGMDKELGQKSLNDKLKETFNLPETTSGQLPGIEDHSPNNSMKRHHYFNNIMNGVNSSASKRRTELNNNAHRGGIGQKFISSTNPNGTTKKDQTTAGANNISESQHGSTASNHTRSVSQPRQAMQPRQRHITQRIEMGKIDPMTSFNRQHLGIQSSAVNSRAPYLAASPKGQKPGPKSVAIGSSHHQAQLQSNQVHHMFLAAGGSNHTNNNTSSGFIKTYSNNNAPQSSSALKQPSLSPYMVSQHIVNRSSAAATAGPNSSTSQSNSQYQQQLTSSSFTKNTDTQVTQNGDELSGATNKLSKITKIEKQAPPLQQYQDNSSSLHQTSTSKQQQQQANERRLLATKRITKIYEVPGFPSSSHHHLNQNHHSAALRKIQAKTIASQLRSSTHQQQNSAQNNQQQNPLLLATSSMTSNNQQAQQHQQKNLNQQQLVVGGKNSGNIRQQQPKLPPAPKRENHQIHHQKQHQTQSRSTNPRTRQQMQLVMVNHNNAGQQVVHQNQDLGSLVQINEDSIMSQQSIQELQQQKPVPRHQQSQRHKEANVSTGLKSSTHHNHNQSNSQQPPQHNRLQQQRRKAASPPGKNQDTKNSAKTAMLAAAVSRENKRTSRMKSREEQSKGVYSGSAVAAGAAPGSGAQQQQSHLNQWSLSRSKPQPSVEDYIVNINGSIRQSGRGTNESIQSNSNANNGIVPQQHNRNHSPPKAVQPKKKLARPSGLTQDQISSQIKHQQEASIASTSFQGNSTTNPKNKATNKGFKEPSTHQLSTNLHEESKMSSIHEIVAASVAKPQVQKVTPLPNHFAASSNQVKVLRSDDDDIENDDLDDDLDGEIAVAADDDGEIDDDAENYSYHMMPDSNQDEREEFGNHEQDYLQLQQQEQDDDDDQLQQQSIIQEEFRQFEKNISQIDSKFNILNSNLQKYQQLTESARVALISRENTTTSRSRKNMMKIADFSSAGGDAAHTERLGTQDEAESSVMDFSNNADQVSGLGRPDKPLMLGQQEDQQNLNSEEEGDDYESDFEQDPVSSSQITPHSAASPFFDSRKIKPRSNAQSKSAFSPKLYSSTNNRSKIGTAGGPRKSGTGGAQSPWTSAGAPLQQENTARSSCSLVTVNSVMTQPQGFRPQQHQPSSQQNGN